MYVYIHTLKVIVMYFKQKMMIVFNKVSKQFEELSLPAEPNAENQRSYEQLQQR